MSNMLHLKSTCATLGKTEFPVNGNCYPVHSMLEKGFVEIGRLNIFLIGLIGVILVGLIVKENENTAFSTSQAVRVQTATSPEIVAAIAQAETVPEATPAETPAIEPKAAPKKHKKNAPIEIVTESGINHSHSEPVTGSQLKHAEVITDNATNHAEVEHKVPEQSKNMIIFSLWSVSELRLRSTFTKIINDGSLPPAIAESRKKDYLTFVNKRTRKCGELHSKFASNINTAEKLTFKDKDVETLECHTAENNTELNRLSDQATDL